MERLKPHTFQILLALSDGDRHGNGIVRRVLELTDSEVRLWPVTLYRALDELLQQGLVEELGDEGHPEGASRRRHYYRLTDAGAVILADEAEKLDSLARVARHNLSTRGGDA